MGAIHNIAPRVAVYPFGAAPPTLEEGWIALAQLPVRAGSSAVFGDGSHATTRLCAAAVDLHCRQHRPQAVLDVGTGTGILARIARARGAGFVVGTDIDPGALASATAHAVLDGPGRGADTSTGGTGPGTCGTAPSTGGSHAVIGHAADILFCSAAPDHWGPRFDLVVANILQAPLIKLLAALVAAIAPGGTLLISGFTRPQIPALRVPYEAAGLHCRGDFNLDEWALLKFAVSGRPSSASAPDTGLPVP